MKVLWVINVPLPEASKLMKKKPTAFGGWLISTARELSELENIELCIAFPNKNKKTEILKGEKITYYTFPAVEISGADKEDNILNIKKILGHSNPDLLHVFGTEFAHTLTFVNEANKKEIKNVVSIQGLVSVIAKHYMTGLPWNVQYRFTLRDLLKNDNLLRQEKKFIKRGNNEIRTLKITNNIIGRTTWDKACVTQVNKLVNYYHCNETLRDKFYTDKWHIDNCERNSIFLSQGNYPIKGLHIMLEALVIVLQDFPDSKLYVAGADITHREDRLGMFKLSSYGKYIVELIKKNKLENKVIFTGILDEENMKKRHLQTHVFVCASIIENSPNSLGEAMLLGIPSVSASVGGVPDLINHNQEGFIYQSDAPYMLAYYICQILKNDDLARKISQNAIKRAHYTHKPKYNLKRLIEIYNSVTK